MRSSRASGGRGGGGRRDFPPVLLRLHYEANGLRNVMTRQKRIIRSYALIPVSACHRAGPVTPLILSLPGCMKQARHWDLGLPPCIFLLFAGNDRAEHSYKLNTSRPPRTLGRTAESISPRLDRPQRDGLPGKGGAFATLHTPAYWSHRTSAEAKASDTWPQRRARASRPIQVVAASPSS